MPPNRRAQGRQAEDVAAAYLLDKGYTLITRRYTAPGGEIDLIALRDGVLVFVEVKSSTRSSDAALLQVDERKRQRFVQAAAHYLASADHPKLPARCDIILVSPQGIRHLPDAFRG